MQDVTQQRRTALAVINMGSLQGATPNAGWLKPYRLGLCVPSKPLGTFNGEYIKMSMN